MTTQILCDYTQYCMCMAVNTSGTHTRTRAQLFAKIPREYFRAVTRAHAIGLSSESVAVVQYSRCQPGHSIPQRNTWTATLAIV